MDIEIGDIIEPKVEAIHKTVMKDFIRDSHHGQLVVSGLTLKCVDMMTHEWEFDIEDIASFNGISKEQYLTIPKK